MKNKFLFLFSLVASAIGATSIIVGNIASGYLMKHSSTYLSEYDDRKSFIEDINYDFLVKGLSFKQADDYKANSNIEKVIAYSNFLTEVEAKGKNKRCNLYVFDDLNQLTYTNFTDKRIIEHKEFSGSVVSVDYKFTQKNKVGIGDKITLLKKDYVINTIYRTNYDETDGTVILPKSEVKGNYITGAYISVKDNSLMIEELKNYKPLGTLLEKTEYQTEEEYQKYLDDFNSKDYSSYIANPLEQIGEIDNTFPPLIKSSMSMVWIPCVIFSLLYFGIALGAFFLNAKNKKDKLYIFMRDNGKKEVKKSFRIIDAFLAVFSLAASLVTIGIVASGLPTYTTFALVALKHIQVIILPIIMIALAHLIIEFKIRKA